MLSRPAFLLGGPDLRRCPRTTALFERDSPRSPTGVRMLQARPSLVVRGVYAGRFFAERSPRGGVNPAPGPDLRRTRTGWCSPMCHVTGPTHENPGRDRTRGRPPAPVGGPPRLPAARGRPRPRRRGALPGPRAPAPVSSGFHPAPLSKKRPTPW